MSLCNPSINEEGAFQHSHLVKPSMKEEDAFQHSVVNPSIKRMMLFSIVTGESLCQEEGALQHIVMVNPSVMRKVLLSTVSG